MTDIKQYTPGPSIGAVKLTTVGAPATHALPDRLEDHLDGRSVDMRSLHG